MAIKTTCSNPKCKQKVSCPDEMAGKEVKCPTCGKPVQIPKAEAPPPEKANRLGKYTIVRKIGEGGMGAVYEAVQDGLGRRVALKVLPKHMTKKPKQLERFRREAHAAAVLNHPNIVMVYEMDEDQGFHFFSMEYVEGVSLQDRIKNGGRLPIKEALGIVRKIAEALDYAWKRGNVIHRDIKPANVLMSKEGHVKLADLGLAKSTEEDSSLTRDNTAMGTPSYMAPEQGRAAKHVDCRADVYALGITLFRLVTGEVPYKGDTALSVMMAHIEEELPDARKLNPEVSDDLWAVIQRMTVKDPESRYQTHAEVLEDIDALEKGVPPVHAFEAPSAGAEPRVDSEQDELTMAAAGTSDTGPLVAAQPGATAPAHQSPILIVGVSLICIAAIVYCVKTIRKTAEEVAHQHAGGNATGENATVGDSTEPDLAPGKTGPAEEPAPGVAPFDAREEALKRGFDAAVAYAAESPQDYDGAIQRFRAVEGAARGSQYAGKALEKRTKLEEQRGQAVEEAWEKLNANVASLGGEDRFKEALQALDTLAGVPDFAKSLLGKERIDGLRRAVQSQLKKRLESIMREADKLAENGDFDRARKTCEDARRFGIPAVEERISVKLSELDRVQEAAKAKEAEQQESLYERACADLTPILRQRKYDEAVKRLGELGDSPEFAAVKDRLEAEKADIRMAETGFQALVKAMGEQIGQQVRIQKATGKLENIQGGYLVINAGGTVQTPIAGLSTKEIVELAARGMRSLDGKTRSRVAFFYYYDGDLDQARAELARAGAAAEGLDCRLFPVLSVKTVPPGAQVDIEMKAGAGAPAFVPGGREEPSRETVVSPARVLLNPNKSVTVRLMKDGYRPAVRNLAVRKKGEVALDVELKPVGLPKAMRADFEQSVPGKDSFGNPVRPGEDAASNYPLEIRHRKSGVDLLFVPAGMFEMGERFIQDATPEHFVTLTRPVYLGKYEVTVGQFKRFVQETGYRTQAEKEGFGQVFDGRRWDRVKAASWRSPGFEQADRHPVVMVSDSDMSAFLKWLNKGDDKPFRLPTEAEWEYACRAGTQTPYFWGSDPREAETYANISLSGWRKGPKERRPGQRGDRDGGTDFAAPVGSLQPNPWGFYDMVGNVFERCSDRYSDRYYAVSPNRDPTGPEDGEAFVNRGGAWNLDVGRSLCGQRFFSKSEFLTNIAGLRVVVALPE
jgi:serine/threonine-protein kinase